MESNNGSINFAVGLDNKQLAADAARSKALLKGIGDTGTEQGSRMEGAFNKASGMVGMMAMGAVASLGMLGKTILDTTAKFEKFGIVLRNSLGNVKGDAALAMISEFAATTPFQLDEVTGAFIKMANQGFVPTRDEMIKLGDLASSTGKNFDQLAEAVLDAQTGQFERLKEFGIKASANGDRVTFSFKEQQTTVENTNSSIQKYLLSLGEMKGIAGANAKISDSLTGQMSNLGDKMAAMYNEIGTANKGFLYAAVGGVSTLVENYKAVGEAIGVLISIYGVAKVATMAVAYAEGVKAAATARSLAIEAQYTALMAGQSTIMMGRAQIATVEAATRVAATNAVIAAEQRLAATTKASSLVNPYVLAAMAVAALGYAIYKVITYQTSAQIAQEKFNRSVQESEKSIEAERLEVDALFARLKAAKEETEEYGAAKKAIFDRYGEQLRALGDEKTALNDIALAYDTITEASMKSARAAGMAKITGEATVLASETTGDARTKINQLLQDKFKGQKGADGIGLAETYFAKIIPVIEGKEEMTAEIQSIIRQFETTTGQFTGGQFNTRIVETKSNALDAEFKKVKGATETLNKTMEAARVAFGEVEKKEEKKDPVLTTYADQIKALQGKKAIIEAELKKLKNTPGENPMKSIVAKQGELDEVNKQLGLKNEEKKAVDAIKVAQENLEKAVKSGNNTAIEGATKTLKALQDQKDLLDEIAKTALEVERNRLIQTKESGKTTEEIIADIKKNRLDKIEKDEAERKKKIVALEGENLDNLRRKQKENADYKENLDNEELDRQKELANGFFDIADAASYLSQQIGDSNQGLANMLKGLGSVAGAFGDLADKGAFSKEGMNKTDAINSGISGATKLVGIFIGQAAENKRVMADYYSSVIRQQNDYNLSLNEQMRLNSQINGSIFFDDFKAKMSDASKALTDATDKKNKAMAEFFGSEAIVGKKNVVNGENVLGGIGAGAAMGAGIGALLGGGVLSLPAAAAGAIIGGVVGAIGGVFAKKKKDIVAPLLDTYPLLIKANGDFDAGLAKTLISSEKVTAETKAILENVIEWEDAARAASDQIKEVIIDMTGTIGTDLRNALVDAFENGTDAAEKFGEATTQILEDLLSETVFNSIFAPALDNLQKGLFASQGLAADGKTPLAPGSPEITGDLMTPIRQFLTLVPGLTELFNGTMTSVNNDTKASTTSLRPMTEAEKQQKADIERNLINANEAAEYLRLLAIEAEWNADIVARYRAADDERMKWEDLLIAWQPPTVTTPGLNLFGGNADDRSGKSKGITGMSQDSADEMNGRLTAMQGHTFSINEGVKILQANSSSILNNVIEIKGHTLSMRSDMGSVKSDMKAVKAGIDTINLNGITLKN